MRALGRRTLPIAALVALGIILTGVLPVSNALWIRMLGIQGAVNIGAFSPTPETGCTHTQGYWKNHPEAWPVEEISLGGIPYSKAEAIAILEVSPQGDATYILAHELIAAKLNIASGADPSAVDGAIRDADQWLIVNPLGSDPEDPARADGIDMAGILAEYNEGALGPRCCDEPEELLEFLDVASPTTMATETATSTATATDTATPTATATPAPTDTPLSIEAPTSTETPTPTDTPPPEASAEDSPTPTETELPTSTESPTPIASESPSG